MARGAIREPEKAVSGVPQCDSRFGRLKALRS